MIRRTIDNRDVSSHRFFDREDLVFDARVSRTHRRRSLVRRVSLVPNRHPNGRAVSRATSRDRRDRSEYLACVRYLRNVRTLGLRTYKDFF